MTQRNALIGIGLLGLLSAGAGIALWPHLPAMLPIHWALDGRVNGELPKAWTIVLMTGLTLFPALFLIAPATFRRQSDTRQSRDTQASIFFMLSALMTYTWGIMLAVGLDVRIDVSRKIIAGVFLFTMLMGNISGRLRRNNVLGHVPAWMTNEIYLAYTRFGARVLFVVGAMGTVAVLAGVSIPLCMFVLVVAAFSPLIYAYLLRRRVRH